MRRSRFHRKHGKVQLGELPEKRFMNLLVQSMESRSLTDDQMTMMWTIEFKNHEVETLVQQVV
jgi:hypothetical protein